VKNQEISDRFNEIADMLDILGEDAFRIISYRRAARQLEALTEDVEDLVREGRVASVPGIGAALGEKIEEYVTTGKRSSARGSRPECLTCCGCAGSGRRR